MQRVPVAHRKQKKAYLIAFQARSPILSEQFYTPEAYFYLPY